MFQDIPNVEITFEALGDNITEKFTRNYYGNGTREHLEI
jgi:hypothetical protein